MSISRVEVPVLTTEAAVDILNKILNELQSTENVQKLDEAKFNVGNEMLKMMQFVFPIVVQIQMQVYSTRLFSITLGTLNNFFLYRYHSVLHLFFCFLIRI